MAAVFLYSQSVVPIVVFRISYVTSVGTVKHVRLDAMDINYIYSCPSIRSIWCIAGGINLSREWKQPFGNTSLPNEGNETIRDHTGVRSISIQFATQRSIFEVRARNRTADAKYHPEECQRRTKDQRKTDVTKQAAEITRVAHDSVWSGGDHLMGSIRLNPDLFLEVWVVDHRPLIERAAC
jgi:hypothetical protein